MINYVIILQYESFPGCVLMVFIFSNSKCFIFIGCFIPWWCNVF